ncbi:proton-associated sugar transporter A [Pararge aegeria]|uniref:Jg10071 protein n=1 Tax=Pararge aegeria aegeria TaxID=348720 RepID=A0A8S4SJP9_9NEOP|nr:proton-associated sugar transporter A [Pararge aegeria]CAH2265513.1 jg10071 [Pararge aegeria aegeria]
MADKLNEYQGVTGRLHSTRDKCKERWSQWKEEHPRGVKEAVREALFAVPTSDEPPERVTHEGEYSDLYRRKSRLELMRISAAVMGIEFSYAGETAFVSPTLLQIGVPHQQMTLVWALSPLIGFFMTPLLGSLSDRCQSKYGRRRPFIVLMSIGVFLGLILVPNGEDIGYAMGDEGSVNRTVVPSSLGPRSSALEIQSNNHHPWGVLFTVLGTVLLDFDADACQSPARAYLLDVTVPEDHAKGLSTFTVMAGLGGFMGYSLGGINWDETSLGALFGGHVRAVFFLITIIFIVCVSATITSFKEIPLNDLKDNDDYNKLNDRDQIEDNFNQGENIEKNGLKKENISYGSLNQPDIIVEDEVNGTNTITLKIPEAHVGEPLSLKHYLKSIVMMPKSLRVVCLTNLFCWMAHVCYSLYFTDFVGESVFGGNPAAPVGSESRINYEAGVRFGCWGMAMYSLSCACYSTIIEKLIKMLGAKKVYVGGLCTYSCGMMMLCLLRARAAVILFSWTAGIMYSTLFTMPYLLVAHYHATGMWDSEGGGSEQERGIGTDVAVVSSCVFVAQLLISVIMGFAVKITGSTAAVVAVAATLAGAAAFTATKITYLDL